MWDKFRVVLEYLQILLNRSERKFLWALLGFSLFVSLTETAGIALMMPFVSIATNINLIFSDNKLFYWYSLFGCTRPAHFIAIIGFLLILFFFIKNSLSVWFIYSINKFAQQCYYRFSKRFFRGFLHSEYQEILQHHSAYISKMVLSDSTSLALILSSSLQLLADLIMFVFIYGVLLWINIKLTMVLTVFFGGMCIVMVPYLQRKVAQAGSMVSEHLRALSRIFHETFANFKIVKVSSNEDFIMDEFSHASYNVARANTINMTIQNITRPLFEIVGLSSLIGVLVYVVYRSDTAVYVVPILSVYALAFYRFLTSVNRIIALYNQISFSVNALDLIDTTFFDKVPISEHSTINFRNKIELVNLSFRYKKDHSILSDINLSIYKGECVGFIGESGIGKSTLVDIISGIYRPLTGLVKIDDVPLSPFVMKNWRKNIGYVPQSIYLFAGTVAKNIVFGRPYDESRIISVLKKSRMYNFLMTHQGLETQVGEGGVKLSGGQRQRIALARAIYTDPEVLILDEATSSLDAETEEKIMNEVYEESVGKTLIVVAHRLSTIARCDRLFRIAEGIVFETKMYRKEGVYEFEKTNI